jgi:hypothetical protein
LIEVLGLSGGGDGLPFETEELVVAAEGGILRQVDVGAVGQLIVAAGANITYYPAEVVGLSLADGVGARNLANG